MLRERSLIRRPTFAIVIGCCAALSLVTACAAEEPEVDDIASLAESGSASSERTEVHPMIEKYGEPVRLRIDMTSDEVQAAYTAFNECIEVEAGVTPESDAEARAGAAQNPKESQAYEECGVLAPLMPWEYDSQNKDARKFVQAVVDCLRGHGVAEVEIDESHGRVMVAFGGESDDSSSVQLGMQFYEQCEDEVVAAGDWLR